MQYCTFNYKKILPNKENYDIGDEISLLELKYFWLRFAISSHLSYNRLLCKIVIGNESTFENPRKKRRPEAAVTIRSKETRVSIEGPPVFDQGGRSPRAEGLDAPSASRSLGTVRSIAETSDRSISVGADTSFSKPSINPLTAIGINCRSTVIIDRASLNTDLHH